MKMRIFEMIRARRARMRIEENLQRRKTLSERFGITERAGAVYITLDGVAIERFGTESVGEVTRRLAAARLNALELAGLLELADMC